MPERQLEIDWPVTGLYGEYHGRHIDASVSPGRIAAIAQAEAEISIEQNGSGKFVVAKDANRWSNDEMAKAVIEGVSRAGGSTLYLGVAHSALAQFIADKNEAASLFVVTAGDRAEQINGLRILRNNGNGIDKLTRTEISDVSASAADILSRPGYDVHRRIRRRSPRFMPIRLGRLASIKAEYAHDLVSSLREEFDTDRPLEGKIIVVDAAHGALQDMPEIILGALGAKRVIQHRSHNLRPINQGGVADIEHVRRDILSHPELINNKNFMGAIAGDGPGEQIRVLGADAITSLSGQHKKFEFHAVPGSVLLEMEASGREDIVGIVSTAYLNNATVRRLHQNNLEVITSPIGDANIVRNLRTVGLDLGGEDEGYLIRNVQKRSVSSTIEAGAALAIRAAQLGTDFAGIAREFPQAPVVRRDIRATPEIRSEILGSDEVAQTLRYVQTELSSGRLVILRESTTTKDIIRLFVMGKDEKDNHALIKKASNLVSGVVERKIKESGKDRGYSKS